MDFEKSDAAGFCDTANTERILGEYWANTERTLGVRAAGDVSATQMGSGFQRVHAQLPDYTLDCPAAHSIFADVCERGYKGAWLDSATFSPTPATAPAS